MQEQLIRLLVTESTSKYRGVSDPWGVCHVSHVDRTGKHSWAHFVKCVTLENRPTFPKKIKTVNKKKSQKKSHEPYKWTEAMCGGYGFCLKTRTVTDCGNGISDKNSPQDLNILKRQVKSDCCTAVSFNPICIITLFMGVMEVKPGAFSEWQMVTPGKQCVTALKKHTFLVMESPKITVDGDKKKARLYQGKTEHNQMSLDEWS